MVLFLLEQRCHRDATKKVGQAILLKVSMGGWWRFVKNQERNRVEKKSEVMWGYEILNFLFLSLFFFNRFLRHV